MTYAQVPSNDSDFAILLADYTRQAGVSDELFDQDGLIRPVWKDLLFLLKSETPEARDSFHARGQQYLRDAGVFFRQYGEQSNTPRELPLGTLPLIIAQKEWLSIEGGLIQRAELLEKVMQDLFGAGDLIQQGIIPASLIAQNPDWIRPVVGAKPRSGNFLNYLAFDIGRGPSGDWWVLGDRAQAPSGMAFALETRLANTRMYPELMVQTPVRRIADFFNGFQEYLLSLRRGDSGAIALLSPGPMNDTYFEHAYIARSLGLLLVQGEDLVVRNGQVFVRTVGGLNSISVLWRRVDTEWLDPLELNESSLIGTAGLLESFRRGGVSLINAPGSGVVEMRALMAFMPKIAEFFGRDALKLPNIATWWCGDGVSRDYVKENFSRMTLDQALSSRLPFDHGEDVIIAGETHDGARFNPQWIDANAKALVAQEIVSLSTAPVRIGGKIMPQPMSVRVFLARSEQGWQVMPGGFARLGDSSTQRNLSVQKGSQISDVWIVAAEDSAQTSINVVRPKTLSRTEDSVLLSRSADNLYWIGRYVERAEQGIRLLRAHHLRITEEGDRDMPITEYLIANAPILGVSVETNLPENVLQNLEFAQNSAGKVRDRFSTDGWNALSDLRRTAERFAPTLQAGNDTVDAMSVLLRKISGFQGLVHDNMHQTNAWRFLSIGRSIERISYMSRLCTVFMAPDAPEGSLALMVDAADSVMTHRRLYEGPINRDTVIDLLVSDRANPRSVHYQAIGLNRYYMGLPVPANSLDITILRDSLREFSDYVSTTRAHDIDTATIKREVDNIVKLSERLNAAYLR